MRHFVERISIVFLCITFSTFVSSQEGSLEQAISFIDEGRYAEAALIIDEQGDLDEADSRAQYYTGLLNIVKGRLRDGIQSIDLALEAESENIDYTYALSRAYEFRGQDVNPLRGVSMARNAKRLLTEVLEANPNHVPSLRALALHLLTFPKILGGEVSEGLQLVPTLTELDEAAALEVKAAYERRNGNTEVAEDYYLQAIATDGDVIHVRVALGKMYFDQERYEDAAEVLEPISYSARPDRWDLPANLRRNRGHIFAAAAHSLLGDHESFTRHATLARETSLFEEDIEAIDYWFDRYGIDIPNVE